MATTPRAFISFDFDHDDDLRNALVGQARYNNSPFFKPDEVDFFLSMGHPSMDALLKLWYTDENGSLSDCATQVFGPNSDINAWQKRHWDNFNRDACFKTKDWEYEHGIRVDGVADGGPSCQHQGGAFEGGGLGVGDGAVLGGFGQDVGHVSVVRGGDGGEELGVLDTSTDTKVKPAYEFRYMRREVAFNSKVSRAGWP